MNELINELINQNIYCFITYGSDKNKKKIVTNCSEFKHFITW